MPDAARGRVALVNMPWSGPESPSIQCGLLKAELLRAGHQVDVHYLNLQFLADFHEDTGIAAALRLGSQPIASEHLFLEWMFGGAAFGHRDDDSYFADFPQLAAALIAGGASLAEMKRLRSEALPSWVSRQADAVPWHDYQVVGFTSTFEQTAASLALARLIKKDQPNVAIVFGGANFDGVMGPEYLRVQPFIDYVVVGEGDLAFPDLVAALSARDPGADIPGVVSRDRQTSSCSGTPVLDIDQIPTPNYDDYFDTLDHLGRERILGSRSISVPFQTSRGCWWGQKHHCKFCGLNAERMSYRAKSPRRAVQEILELADRYQVRDLDAVDNIMDHGSRRQLCQLLADSCRDLRIFYEVKANMTRSQLSELAAAGICQVQPGIESLSTHMLTLMNKGATMLLNLRFLKWAHFHGIQPQWHILTGFPGETVLDYTSQIELMPQLYHLPPPSSCVRLWIDRYSPYFAEATPGIERIRPRAAYRHVLPIQGINLDDVAYYFDYELAEPVPEPVHGALSDAVSAWNLRWHSPSAPALTYCWQADSIVLTDRRGQYERIWELSPMHSHVLSHCGDTYRSLAGIQARLGADGIHMDTPAVTDILAELVDRAVLVVEDGHYLGLALPDQTCS